MKIFITGGSGFVGTTLTQKLTELGHQATILTRSLKSGQRRIFSYGQRRVAPDTLCANRD